MVGFIVEEAGRYYGYRAIYDYECYFKSNLSEPSDKQMWEAYHIPLSISIHSNVPGHEQSVCFVTDGNSTHLVERMLTKLHEISVTAYDSNLECF